MVRYLFLVLLLLAQRGVCISPEPIPTCTVPAVKLNALPISLHETQSFVLDHLFTGFNLQFNLTDDAPDFAVVSQKISKVKTDNTTKQPGLKSYHLEHHGNKWGSTLITLSDDNMTTMIRWGASSANDTTPQLQEELSVQSEPDTVCFDAVWIRHAHLAIVDCVKRATFGLQNVFKYVNTTAKTNLPHTVQTDMYISFTTITRRRMFTFRKHGSEYLVRSYLGNHVDAHHDDNTYIQIMSFDNPLWPRTIKVIDRTFLSQDKLSVTDIKPYNGRIFVLDYHSGMTVFDVLPSQHIIIDYRYQTDSGYVKMGVFRGKLDNELICVFANSHAIYEIDFTNHLQPRIIAKYNLMQYSIITSLWVNQHYVIAQVSANVSNSQNLTQVYNASIVFSHGTRTYLNAYDMIAHKSDRVIIDFQRYNSYMLVIDEEEIDVYKLNRPILTINPTDNTTLNQTYKFNVNGLSVNQFNGHSASCVFTFKYTVTSRDAMTLWETGLHVPDKYYANSPGEFFIPLNRYVLGSNITYGVLENSQTGKIPEHWILQQNATAIFWQREPMQHKITFLRQEQYDSIAETDLFIYMQDESLHTYIVKCQTVPYNSSVFCEKDGTLPYSNMEILNLTANRFILYGEQYVHVAALVYKHFPNEVFIYQAQTKQVLTKPIMLPESYEGKITSIEMLGHFLVVVLRYIKEIVFFDMRKCINSIQRKCEQLYRIDSIMMQKLGVTYFSPIDVKVSKFHRFVLFIQSFDRVLILAITSDGPELLTQIQSPGSKEPGFFHWKMAISKDHIVLVNPPNVIEEHSIRDMYATRQALMTRSYPLYNYVIPAKFDLDFSDAGGLIYITAQDSQLPDGINSTLLVYRAGVPSVAALFDVYHLYGTYDDIIVEATGNFGDYITVSLNNLLHMYRQYQIPILVFDQVYDSFQFNLTYTNDPQGQYHYLSKSAVNVVNYPQTIAANDSKLNDKDFLNNLIDYQESKLTVSLNDSQWWIGNVVNYTIEGCKDCDKFKVVNHLEGERNIVGEMDMEDFVLTYNGGLVQQMQTVMMLRHNDSIHQFVNLPSTLDGENCKHIAFDWLYDYSISACSHQNEQIILYWTTYTSFKPHVSGPFYSSASSVARIDLQGDLLMLVDVDEDPSIMARQGGVFLYQFNHDTNQKEIFDELEFIGTNDLVAAQGWIYGDRVYIGNAHLVYTNVTNLYRLSITQLLNGVFFVDFRWKKGMRSVQIVNLEFMDLREELFKNHMPLPNLAFFESITTLTEFYNSGFKYWEIDMVVTTRNFHILQVNCFFDSAGKLLDHRIVRVYYRYGFYETSNYIKSFDGYFAVVQKVPLAFTIYPWYSKQVLTVYDTKDKFHLPKDSELGDDQTISASYILGGMVLPEGRVTFDFKFSFKRKEGDPFYNIGLIALHNRQGLLREIRINNNLSIVIKDGLTANEDINLVAHNDYSQFKIPINLSGSTEVQEGFPWWAIVLIVGGALIIGVIVAYILYIKLFKKRDQGDYEKKESLLEKGADEDEDNSDSSDDDDEDDEDQELSEEDKPAARVQPVIQTAINRESAASDGPQGQDKQQLQQAEEVAEEPEGSEDSSK